MSKQTIAILGATSALAKEYARLHCNENTSLILVGRNVQALSEIKADLVARGAVNVQVCVHDFEDLELLPKLIDFMFQNVVDVALVAYGTLPDQNQSKISLAYLLKHHTINSTSILSCVSLIAQKMKMQHKGTIAVITSVAGDRGKKSNYYYGAAKASISVFLQGLRQDLYKDGVHVVDIKPGFVDTPMTKDFPKGLLWSKPACIAKGIDKSIKKRRNTAYLPCFWKYIMCVIKSIPECIFKKMEM